MTTEEIEKKEEKEVEDVLEFINNLDFEECKLEDRLFFIV